MADNNPVYGKQLYQDDGTLEALEQDLIKIDATLKNVAKTVKVLKTETESMTSTNKKQRDSIQENATKADKLAQENEKLKQSYTNTSVEIKKIQAVRKKQNQLTKLEIQLAKSAEGSYNKLSAQYSLVKIKLNAMSKAQRENSITGKAMVVQSKALYTEMNRLQQQTGKNQLQVGNYSGGIKQAAGSLVGFTSGVGAAMLAISKGKQVITDAIETNRTWEKSFTNVITLLDKGDKEKFGAILEKGTLDLMADYGLAIEDTNKALFDAISAGIPAGEAVAFLKESATLAIGGVTDLTTAVDGITSVLNAYGLEAEKTNEVAGAFFSAQKFGKTTVAELSAEIGKVAPIAKQAGIGYKTLLATFAELTKQGIKTTDASTALKSTITALLKPAEGAAAKFKELGISTGAAAVKQEGFLNILKQISKAAAEDEDALVELIPNIRALTGVGALGEEQLKELDEILNTLGDDFGENSSLIAAFNEQMETAEKSAERMKGSWDRLIITIGGGESIFKKLGNSIRADLTNRFNEISKTLEVTGAQWDKFTGKITDEEFREILEDIAIRYGLIEESQKKVNEEGAVGAELTKQQIVLINQYNKELGDNLKLNQASYEIAKEYYKEVEVFVTTLSSLNTELSNLKKEYKEIDIRDESALMRKGEEIRALERQIKEIKELGEVLKVTSKALEEFKLDDDDIKIDDESTKIFAELEKSRTDELDKQLKARLRLEEKQAGSLLGLFLNSSARKKAIRDDLNADEIAELEGNNDKIEEAAVTATEFALNNLQQLYAAKVEFADEDLRLAERAVDASINSLDNEIRNRELGFANNVATANKELENAKRLQEKATKEKAKAVKQQQTLDTITQTSSLITASANIWSSMSIIPVVGPLLAVAALALMWGSFAYSKTQANQAASTNYGDGGMFDVSGGSHASGNDTSLGVHNGRERRVEKGEKVGVLNANMSRKYGSTFEDIMRHANKGTLDDILNNGIVGVQDMPQHMLVNAGVDSPDLKPLERDVGKIRKQGESNWHTNANGQNVRRYKNLKTTYV